jgi:GNAT superfamily N-acetyltransferase
MTKRVAATSFIIRKALAPDIPALAALQVETFYETHGKYPGAPTYEIREQQWEEQFKKTDGSWFCFVIENESQELVGFAKGVPYNHADQKGFSGELNKIYILREYQNIGLGRRLVGVVGRQFLSQGISSMLLFGEAKNHSNVFYEALNGERLYARSGEFHGGYGWRDLKALMAVCPV